MRVIFYIRDIILRLLKMGCSRMRKCDNYAVSEMISLLLSLVIFTSIFTAIMLFGIPYMNDQKATVAFESNLIQLDTVGDLMEDVFSEGAFTDSTNEFGSSKSMTFKMGDGSISLDEKGTRFVFWFSNITDFVFEVNNLDFDENPDSFELNIIDSIGDFDYRVHIIYLNTGSDETPTEFDFSTNPNTINTDGSFLEDAIQIDVEYDYSGAGTNWQIVGRIYLFDTGSIVYSAPASSRSQKAIVENGGVYSAGAGTKSLFYNEPKYWNQTLFDNINEDSNAMLTLLLIQLKSDPKNEIYSVGGSESLRVNLKIDSDENNILESKTRFYGNFYMEIYGEESSVFTWKYFYKNRLNFLEDGNGQLSWLPGSDNVFFSLIHSINYLTMEV